MNRNYLLLFMLLCYLIPIYYVYYYYDFNHSVSNIICNDQCKYAILFFMFWMGVGTLLYELERNDTFTTSIIGFLLVGIYGLIYIHENNRLHYVFASIALISILGFMIRQCYVAQCDSILQASLILEIILLLRILAKVNKANIFYDEILYIINFALYYLYLHFIQ